MKYKMLTKTCKICFKDFYPNSMFSLLHPSVDVCDRCFQEIKMHFFKFEVLGYKAISIYRYDERVQSLLFQFKGCFDFELFNIYFERFSAELSIKYKGYVMVPIPSFKDDDEIRGFNHVEEMFKPLKLPMRKMLIKTKRFKQATSSAKKRRLVKTGIELVDDSDLSNYKILLVDDVYTTGSTMKTCIRLIEKLHPKNIQVLVMSKTENKD